ncbi:hypothetical protein FIV42_04145 [Persicimonas caeni]|uniref:Aminoglycoside phosphotransferase domain-containing protein n=1 Tax=Persicimonas caeni TaxID=2292766 RepID=A0A4Y6PPN1_PERCE|nr:phosphotransferase [Persicimonas caeni]QDG49951.1 hypothetical protein FIV42_04115 [Persicimonas caeni]QDG49957.1 hypothetical protein FIV42_04145 [Persicimonas caeni]QED31172.1 phosphotransferase [Persicimonas caeni]QED31178.1 phosphotransferase [Persicimonas caeni]
MSQDALKAVDVLQEVLAAQPWQPTEDPAVEGRGLRVRVHLDDQRSALLYVWDEALLAKRAAWAHRPERAGMLFAVPELIESGLKWCLVDDVDGMPLTTYLEREGVGSVTELDAERARGLAREAGELARKLHEIEVPREYGDMVDPDRDGHIGRWNTFNGYIAHRLEHFAEQIRHRDLDEEVRSQLLATIGDLRAELAAFHPRHAPSLNHGAFGPQHFWVDETGRTITALTGFDGARLLPPEADLARLLWLDGLACDDGLVRSFYAGYGAARTMDLQRRERFYRRVAALEALVESTGRRNLTDAELVALSSP